MPYFSFIIFPKEVGQLHDILTCLARFSEDVSLEATPDSFCIYSLNASKSAHARFTLSPTQFLRQYVFEDSGAGAQSRSWACTLQNRALASIFKKRNFELKDRETALERCEVQLQARADTAKCRLLFRMICKNGIVKNYKLTYEPTTVLSPTFDSDSSTNRWTASARALRHMVEFFGTKTDHLDWSFEQGKVKLTSSSQKPSDDGDIRKLATQTSVTIERSDFEEFSMDNRISIGIVLKDFRAITSHADTLEATVSAKYSGSNRPMLIAYQVGGLSAAFTLMTRQLRRDGLLEDTPAPVTPARDLSIRMSPRSTRQSQSSGILHQEENLDHSATLMPPPAPTDTHVGPRPEQEHPSASTGPNPLTHGGSRNQSPPAPSATLNQNSLFFSAADDEEFWGEHENDTVEQEDFVTWDSGGRGPQPSTTGRQLRDTDAGSALPRSRASERPTQGVKAIEPTQRLSQVKGLFD